MAKVLGMEPRTALFVVGGTAAAAAVYLWWRSRQAAATPAATASTGCTDSSGNSVPCPDTSGVDTAGQLSVIQTELESLLSSQAGDTDKTGTTTTTPPPSTDKGAPGEPTGLKITSVTTTGFKASWTAPVKTAKGAVATGYTYDIEQGSKLVKSATTTATSVTATGLKRGTSYTFFVRACAHPGCSKSVTAQVKTKGSGGGDG